MSGKGSKRRVGKPGAYEAGWKRVFGRRAEAERLASIPKERTCACGNPPVEDHTCPYAEEINGDDRLCDCCDDCRRACAWAI